MTLFTLSYFFHRVKAEEWKYIFFYESQNNGRRDYLTATVTRSTTVACIQMYSNCLSCGVAMV